MFLITFTIFRVIPFPYIVYRCFQIILALWDSLSFLEKCLVTFCQIQATVVLVLNYYWYSLILKGLIRLLEENGILKKKRNYEDLDAYEKYTEIKIKEE